MQKLFTTIPRIEGKGIVLKRLKDEDAAALQELMDNQSVYRYLPTYLFEKQCANAGEAIRLIYGAPVRNKESLILGVYDKGTGEFCGLGEFYGYRDSLHKISMGYRLLERCWGRGIATEAVSLMVDYLYTKTDIEIITASTMVENAASARVLEKNGFIRTARGVEEDWGYDHPTIADKWFC